MKVPFRLVRSAICSQRKRNSKGTVTLGSCAERRNSICKRDLFEECCELTINQPLQSATWLRELYMCDTEYARFMSRCPPHQRVEEETINDCEAKTISTGRPYPNKTVFWPLQDALNSFSFITFN